MGLSWNSIAFGVTTTRTPFRIRHVQVAVLAVAMGSVVCAQIPAPTNSDEVDRQFLRELNRRQLYDLATDYSRDRIRRHTNEESRAFWVDQLSTVYRHRAWEESDADRKALTELSIESITEYLRDHVVAPETNLALRLNQIEGLLNQARINRLLHMTAHRGPATDIRRPESVGVLPFIDRAMELAGGLLKQLDAVRGQLDRQRVSRLREQGKCLSVELAVTRYLSIEAVSAKGLSRTEQQNELRKRLKSLERSARLLVTRQVVQQLLAELQIDEGDFNGLDLNLAHRNSPLSESQRIILEIRSLLKQGKATAALQRCNTAADTSGDNGSELSVLRLESLLLLSMLANDLQDVSLVKLSNDDFVQYSERALKWRASVWRDAAIRITGRYQLVNTVGTKVATLVEHVETLRADGQSEEALRELQRALRLLPPKASLQSRAAIHLRMGEILITQQEWKTAIRLLQQAAQLFTKTERPKAASTAALLAVFCIGQQWKLAPENRELRQKYFDGLIQHRRHWPQETTRQKSTAWLVLLTQQTDPLYAAEILAEEAAEENPFAERLQRVIQLGEQLERSRWRIGESRSSKTWAVLAREWQSFSEQYELTPGSLTDKSARLFLLQASLSTNAQTTREVWDQLHQRLTEAAAAVKDIDPVTLNRLNRLQLMATARISTDSTVLKHQKSKYLSETSGERLQAARQLARYLNAGGMTEPGDKLIAATVEQLIARRIPQSPSTAELSNVLQLATLSYRVTGDDSTWNLLLNELLKRDLTVEQNMEIAEILMKSTSPQSAQGMSGQSAFWKRIRTESKDGSDLWLESCLQLARIQAQRGKVQKAARQLRVTSVIYPEWGSEERRRRVEKFLRDL